MENNSGYGSASIKAFIVDMIKTQVLVYNTTLWWCSFLSRQFFRRRRRRQSKNWNTNEEKMKRIEGSGLDGGRHYICIDDDNGSIHISTNASSITSNWMCAWWLMQKYWKQKKNSLNMYDTRSACLFFCSIFILSFSESV